MTRRTLATAIAIACAALVLGAVFGRPGNGEAAATAPPAPTISGTPQEGQTLTASDSGGPYTWAWERCDTSGNGCSAIAGATASTYTLASADVGHTIRVTATDGSGSTESAPTAVVANAAAPKNTAPPTISGTAQVGSTLTASQGTWSGNPTKYAYAWDRCDSKGNSCAAISGATSSTYTLTNADARTTLRAAVTASNSTGSATADSAPTAVVPASVADGCPSGTGTVQASALTAPARLAVEPVAIAPSRVTRSTRSIQLHFRITACNGRPVQGARVFAVAIPYEQFRGATATSAADGTVSINEPRQSRFPASGRQELLAVLVRATKPGDPIVGGVSTRRAVAFPVSLR
jgi:hypothetical protein